MLQLKYRYFNFGSLLTQILLYIHQWFNYNKSCLESKLAYWLVLINVFNYMIKGSLTDVTLKVPDLSLGIMKSNFVLQTEAMDIKLNHSTKYWGILSIKIKKHRMKYYYIASFSFSQFSIIIAHWAIFLHSKTYKNSEIFLQHSQPVLAQGLLFYQKRIYQMKWLNWFLIFLLASINFSSYSLCPKFCFPKNCGIYPINAIMKFPQCSLQVYWLLFGSQRKIPEEI